MTIVATKKRSSDFSEGQQAALLVGTAIEVLLTAVALADLVRSPCAQLNRCCSAFCKPTYWPGSAAERCLHRSRVPGNACVSFDEPYDCRLVPNEADVAVGRPQCGSGYRRWLWPYSGSRADPPSLIGHR